MSWECAEQLFKQELEADDDIRLSVRLYQRCLADKKRFCADVDPGHAEAKDCLIDHRNDEGFSAACRCEGVGEIQPCAWQHAAALWNLIFAVACTRCLHADLE